MEKKLIFLGIAEQTHSVTHPLIFLFVFQINSPQHLPLKDCGKVVQAACGGTQVAILNGTFIQLHIRTVHVTVAAVCEL